jgi:hypothetical protein
MIINVGDVVTLKSGSPRLTVTNIAGQTATCSLFRNGEVKYFPLVALEPLQRPPETPLWMRLVGWTPV